MRQWLKRLLGGEPLARDDRAAIRAERDAEHELAVCFRDAVLPGLGRARDALNQAGYAAILEHEDHWARLIVAEEAGTGSIYTVEGRLYFRPSFAFPALHGDPQRPQYAALHIECQGHVREWRPSHCDAEAIAADAEAEIRKWLSW